MNEQTESATEQTETTQSTKRRKWPWIVGIVGAITVFGIIGTAIDDGGSDDGDTEQAAAQDGSDDNENVDDELAEDERIKKAVRNAVGDETGHELHEVGVVESDGGEFLVTVTFEVTDVFTAGSAKTDMEDIMADTYMAVYPEHDVHSVSVHGQAPLVDNYGNEDTKTVYSTLLEKSEADKVNWDADESSLQVTILPDVWETKFLHPAFNE